MLLFLPSNPSIQSLQDALDRNYKVYYWKGTVTESYLKSFGSGTAGQQIYQCGQRGGCVYEIDKEALDLVRSDQENALFENFVTYVRDGNLDIVSVSERLRLMTSFGLQNNYEFLGMFNYHLGKIKSSGVLAKLYQKWLRYEIFYMPILQIVLLINV